MSQHQKNRLLVGLRAKLILNHINDDAALDFFEFSFDEKMIDLIIKEINKYWKHSASDKPHNLLSYRIVHIFNYRKNKIYDYQSTNPLIIVPMFGSHFSIGRFLLLLRVDEYRYHTWHTHRQRVCYVRKT